MPTIVRRVRTTPQQPPWRRGEIAGGTQNDMPDMTDGTGALHATGATKPAGQAACTTRDYVKALVLITLIVSLVGLAFWIGIGGFCACLTRPAG